MVKSESIWDDEVKCPGCGKFYHVEDMISYHDRHGIYSGRACSDECARVLPGQGNMWNYNACEDIEPDAEVMR